MIITNEIEYICKNSDPPPSKQCNVKTGDLTLPFSVNDRKGKRTAGIFRHNQQAQSNENAHFSTQLWEDASSTQPCNCTEKVDTDAQS